MGKFRYTLRRWRSVILGKETNEVASPSRPPEPVNELTDEPQILGVEPPLDPTTVTISEKWKDLPQELIDHIVLMLGDDLKSLKACSLTCKAMFFSARRIIHRKIRLTSDKNWELLTVPERQRYIRGERQGIAVRVLSTIAAQGLLPYARHLSININKNFTPANLQPFIHHFQCFDRVQEFTIDWLDTPGFLEHFDTYFANFVPTLHSLHLDNPTGDTRDILDFVCRFPHLDDLTFSMASGHFAGSDTWRSRSLPVVKRVPPFRGRLKLNGISGWRNHLLFQLISLPGKRRFRFIDFQNCDSDAVQSVVDGCSGTLESVSTVWRRYYQNGLPLNLVDATNLRSLTLRVDFQGIVHLPEVLFRTLSTITSPFFSEFVLEVVWIPENLKARDASKWWGVWTRVDEIFERINIERDLRVVIRPREVVRVLGFTAQAENRLPLMAARKGIVFEIGGQFPEE